VPRGRIEPHRADGESNRRENGIAKIGGSDQRQATDDGRNKPTCHTRSRVTSELARPPDHRDNSERKRNRNKGSPSTR